MAINLTMTEQGKKSQSTGKNSANLSPKQARDERLKKSLRANLQRRKAKIRAMKSSDQD